MWSSSAFGGEAVFRNFEFLDSIRDIVVGDAEYTQVLKDQTHSAQMSKYVRQIDRYIQHAFQRQDAP